jgi:hypothetical protein
MARMEGLLQQLVDLQMANLRPTSCQSGWTTPVMQEGHEVNDNSSALSYIDDPELVPTRGQHRAHFADQAQTVPEGPPSALVDDDKMAILASLKKLRMKQQVHASCSGDLAFSQGQDESDLNYEIRMNRSARAAVMAEFRAGATTAYLYRALAPQDRFTLNNDPPARCPHLLGPNAIPLPFRQRQNNMQEFSHNHIGQGEHVSPHMNS